MGGIGIGDVVVAERPHRGAKLSRRRGLFPGVGKAAVMCLWQQRGTHQRPRPRQGGSSTGSTQRDRRRCEPSRCCWLCTMHGPLRCGLRRALKGPWRGGLVGGRHGCGWLGLGLLQDVTGVQGSGCLVGEFVPTAGSASPPTATRVGLGRLVSGRVWPSRGRWCRRSTALSRQVRRPIR